MKKTIKKCIAFLLCLHTVLFVVFQVSSVVMAASDSYGQFVTSGEVLESQETLEETLESEETEESVEETLESEETEESVEETLESEESAEDASEETLESEESKESTEESAEETLESEDNTEESSEDEEATEDSLESEERGEETSEKMEDSSEINAIDEDETELEGNTELGDDTQDGTTLEWMSYADYRAAEAARAWSNPELFVGQTAIFNAEWGEFACVPSIDVINFGDGTSTIDDTDFVDSGDVFYDNLLEFATWLTAEEVFDAEGNSIEVVITEAYFDDTLGFESLWYRVEAAEGYVLPDKLVENPYVMHLTFPDDVPSFLMLPMKGMFVGETVYVQKEKVAASKGDLINVADVPEFFDVVWCMGELDENAEEGTIPLEFYDLGNVSDWTGITDPEYRYVSASSVILIPAEVSRAYETLMSVEDSSMYETILSYIPEEVKAQFTSKHKANLEEHIQYLHVIENVEKTEYVTIGGVEVPVTVHGKIPMDGTLSVEAVTSDTVMAEGFDIKDASEIVTALDIKIYDKDGVEWQPEDGNRIWVSIGMAEFGYADGSILKLQHKHGEKIDTFDVFVVLDGKVTVGIYGFSMFVVSQVGSAVQTGIRVNNSGSCPLEVGQEVIFYFDKNSTAGRDKSYEAGTWRVTDTSGAIYYTVHSDSAEPNYQIDNNGIYAPWIKINTLKTTTDTTQITLRFDYGNINGNNFNGGYEVYTINIVPPSVDLEDDPDGYRLYIKDTVNTTGTITATLVDVNGNEVTEEMLGGSLSCSWERSDDSFIIPAAYQNGGKSIDICRDHGGLLQTRLENIVYTVTAKLPNGRTKTASYKVYYQSEILNSSFENPEVNADTYTFLTNGWPGLYWKTTSPGEGVNLSKDVELVRYSADWDGVLDPYSNYNFYPDDPGQGNQIAELNAEKFGALYQDIITAPGEDLTWDFLHAKRDTKANGEAMYLIMGPTEHAQGVTDYGKLSDLISAILGANTQTAINNMINNGGSIAYTYTDSETGAKYTYTAWYHSAENDGRSADEAWTLIGGEYEVPPNQYRTRLFFVTDPVASGSVGESNYGNLIDSTRGGQYKRYLIEYYEEDYVTDDETGDTIIRRTHIAEYDEKNRAPIYSSVNLDHFDEFEKKNEILSTVFINGVNSPYNIRYAGVPCLFIEKYSPEASTTPHLVENEDSSTRNDYSEYDIVMQVCFRKTMVAVQKWVTFPKIGNTETEALTMEQKQSLIDGLNGKKGYEAHYILDCETEECKRKAEGHRADDSIYITKNDPKGWYTGYIPMGYDLDGTHSFKLTESSVSLLAGLEIAKVELKYYQFHKGVLTLMDKKTYADSDYIDYDKNKPEQDTVGTGYNPSYIASGKLEVESDSDGDGYVLVYNNNGVEEEVYINDILLNSKDDERKIAEVKVTNTYREKTVTYNYVAVGHGKIEIQDNVKAQEDSDSEKFLYYSGDPEGAKPYPEQDYTFAGWYLDAECTIPVDANHGYVEDDGGFVPNKAKTVSDDVLEVTYYAKFSIGSIQIIREDAEPGQVFVYEVRDELGETMYVTVVIGADGKGSTEIVNASFGNNNEGLDYTVTQLNDWSWRYKKEDDDENKDGNQSITQTHKETEGLHGAKNMTTVFRFPVVQKDEEPYWLNGNSAVIENIYGGGAN